MSELPELRPFDHLLYFDRRSLFDWIVAVKTWTAVSHIEVYQGGGMAMAARAGGSNGVRLYPLRRDGLLYVLRPRNPFDLGAAMQWFYTTANGQRYDYVGLLNFTLAAHLHDPRRMFCSELARRLNRQAKFESFHECWDADRTAPANFLMSPAFDHLWKAPREPLHLVVR